MDVANRGRREIIDIEVKAFELSQSPSANCRLVLLSPWLICFFGGSAAKKSRRLDRY
jgi:hypothetical protein